MKSVDGTEKSGEKKREEQSSRNRQNSRSPLGPRRNPKRRHTTSFLDPLRSLRSLRCPNQNPKTSDPTTVTAINFLKNSKPKKSLEFPASQTFGPSVSSLRSVHSVLRSFEFRACFFVSKCFFNSLGFAQAVSQASQ